MQDSLRARLWHTFWEVHLMNSFESFQKGSGHLVHLEHGVRLALLWESLFPGDQLEKGMHFFLPVLIVAFVQERLPHIPLATPYVEYASNTCHEPLPLMCFSHHAPQCPRRASGCHCNTVEKQNQMEPV
eukprot:1182477-Prorocentrum_minimum.AAC.1